MRDDSPLVETAAHTAGRHVFDQVLPTGDRDTVLNRLLCNASLQAAAGFQNDLELLEERRDHRAFVACRKLDIGVHHAFPLLHRCVAGGVDKPGFQHVDHRRNVSGCCSTEWAIKATQSRGGFQISRGQQSACLSRNEREDGDVLAQANSWSDLLCQASLRDREAPDRAVGN